MTRQTLQVTVLAAALLALCACKSQYTNYPVVPTAKGSSEDPNSPGAEEAIVASLQFVANRYSPGTPRPDAANAKEAGKTAVDFPMAVAAPTGMRRSFYERICREVGPGAVPLTPDVLAAGKPPVYYVTRAWMRGVEGQVDVMRPMNELGPGSNGKPVYQTVTLRLKGGVEPWHVIHARAWEPGIDPIPEPYFLPDIERIDQYRYTVSPTPPPAERQYWKAGKQPTEGAGSTTPAPGEGKEPNASVETPSEPPAQTGDGPVVTPAEPK